MTKKHDGSLRRLGDTEKCPACGARIDSSAYRCIRCRIYFCFKCRRRVPRGEPQYQCVDQQCKYYGKLLCKGCTIDVPEVATVAKRRLVKHESVTPGNKRQILSHELYVRRFCTLTGMVAAIMVILGMGFWSEGRLLCLGVFIAPLVFIPVAVVTDLCCTFYYRGKIIPIEEVRVPAVYEDYTEEEEIARHRCCIACRHPVEHL